jgi:hypothetical protein
MLTATARRFPPPWSAEELDARFVVRDHGGQKLAHIYSRMSWTDYATL